LQVRILKFRYGFRVITKKELKNLDKYVGTKYLHLIKCGQIKLHKDLNQLKNTVSQVIKLDEPTFIFGFNFDSRLNISLNLKLFFCIFKVLTIKRTLNFKNNMLRIFIIIYSTNIKIVFISIIHK